MLVPCGTPFGIKMFTNGVVVVGMSDIDSESGKANPATEAGLKIGDIITNINGETVNENEEVSEAIQDCNGEPLVLTVKRDTEILEISLNPVKSSQDGPAGTLQASAHFIRKESSLRISSFKSPAALSTRMALREFEQTSSAYFSV